MKPFFNTGLLPGKLLKILWTSQITNHDPDVLEDDYDEAEINDDDFGEDEVELLDDITSDEEFSEEDEPSQIASFMRNTAQEEVDESNLPKTVTVLSGENGEKAYVVGTAHFSPESCEDVKKVISMVQPDAVMVELCASRALILSQDESYIEKLKNSSWTERLNSFVKERGMMSGLIVFLLQECSNSITKQLDMTPGEEMRTAHKEASKVPGCTFHLGDRRIEITLKRLLARLTLKDKILLGLKLYRELSESISPEEVEQCKTKDAFEKLHDEICKNSPHMAAALIHERDLYLTAYLKRILSHKLPMPGGFLRPPVAVAVVGLGHTPGMTEHFKTDADPKQLLEDLNKLPVEVPTSGVLKLLVKGTVFTVTIYTVFRVLSLSGVFTNYPSLSSL